MVAKRAREAVRRTSRHALRHGLRVAPLLGAALAAALSSCEREQRRFSEVPPTATSYGAVVLSDLQPGTRTPEVDVATTYEHNAYAISEGQRLFDQWNCSGCHAHGGGGMGPPLMDDEWIYGSEPENIVATILEGRPNGMPSFRGRVSTPQVWQLAAYVRSMSGLTPKDARPGRTDHMQYKQQEQSKKPEDAKRAQEAPPASVTP